MATQRVHRCIPRLRVLKLHIFVGRIGQVVISLAIFGTFPNDLVIRPSAGTDYPSVARSYTHTTFFTDGTIRPTLIREMCNFKTYASGYHLIPTPDIAFENASQRCPPGEKRTLRVNSHLPIA